MFFCVIAGSPTNGGATKQADAKRHPEERSDEGSIKEILHFVQDDSYGARLLRLTARKDTNVKVFNQ